MKINSMTTRNYMLEQYQLNSGGVNVNKMKQLQPDKKNDNSNSAVDVTISDEAKRLNQFRLKNSDE